MEELALHILDVVENSIRAGAGNVEIEIEEDPRSDRLVLVIRDDGAGMDEAAQSRALDPFFTTKRGKTVGLGLAMLAEAASRAGGTLAIRSEAGHGTEVRATFRQSHVDRQPLGSLAETLETLIVGNPGVEFRLLRRTPAGEKRFDTRELKRALHGVAVHSGRGIGQMRKALEELAWP